MCNLCSLNFIKLRAKKEGKKITIIPASGFLGGIDVYVHPKEINIKKLEGFNIPDHPNRDKYFRAWFMEIPSSHVD